MTRCSPIFILCLIFLLLTSVSLIHGQIAWKIGCEAGSYNTSSVDVLERSNFCAKLNGEFGYQYSQESNKANLQIKFRPEWYGNGIEKYLLSTKLRAKGGYSQFRKNYNWSLNLSAQKHYHSVPDLNIYFNHYLLQFSLTWLILEKKPININLGYGHQNIDIKGEDNQNNDTDLVYFDCKIFNILSSFTKIGGGLYLENFSTINKKRMYTLWKKINHKGWKTGPHFCVNYLESFIVNFDYRFLFHESNITSYPSHEHWIRLLAGKLIIPKLSTFILVDYYVRNFKFQEKDANNYFALTTPANSENRIYLKVAYDITGKIEIYTKYGYFNENLYYKDYSLAGWQGVIGIEFKN